MKALVLEAPFTSVVDVGRQVWWFLPLRLIMTDQYRTIDRIGSVRVPLLILHGARDSLIPVSQARQIYAAANEPKNLAILRRGAHNDLFDHGAWDKVTAFLDTPERVRQPAVVRPGSVRAGGFGVIASQALAARRLAIDPGLSAGAGR